MIEIPLTQGQFAIIDDEDADLLNTKWYAAFQKDYSGGGAYVAQRTIMHGNKKSTEYLHRVILGRVLDRPLLRIEDVDHVDRNPLHCQRTNLRLATRSQNGMNKHARVDNSSGYKGVYFRKKSGKWEANIKANGESRFLGSYKTAEEAYAAYCRAALELHGEFVNIPNAETVESLTPKRKGMTLKNIGKERGLSVDQLMTAMWEKHHSIPEIVKELGITQPTAYNWFRKHPEIDWRTYHKNR